MIPKLEVKGPLKGSSFHHPKQFTKNVDMDLPRALVLSGEDVFFSCQPESLMKRMESLVDLQVPRTG